MRFYLAPSTIATAEEMAVPKQLQFVQSIEVQDEARLYKELSTKLIALEKMIDYDLENVEQIKQQVQKMMIALDEKEELLTRCNWLVTMKEIEKQLPLMSSLKEVQAAKRQLGRVQTCPLKNELKQKLESLEASFTPVEKQLSPKEVLVESIFKTGNETFINLGTAGRDYILEMVLQGEGTVEAAIAKAEELEMAVQAAKQQTNVAGLHKILQTLPLPKLAHVPSKYLEELLQKLIDQPNWHNLFHLDCLIHRYTLQLTNNVTTSDEIEEGFISTINVTEQSLKQFGIQ